MDILQNLKLVLELLAFSKAKAVVPNFIGSLLMVFLLYYYIIGKNQKSGL